MRPFFRGETAEMSKADERILGQMAPPSDVSERTFKRILERHKVRSKLLAFYTSSTKLKIDEEPEYPYALRDEETSSCKVRDSRENNLFQVYLDPERRKNRSNEHEFIVVGLNDSGPIVMLVEPDSGVYRHVNWRLRWTNLTVDRWMNQQPVQRLSNPRLQSTQREHFKLFGIANLATYMRVNRHDMAEILGVRTWPPHTQY